MAFFSSRRVVALALFVGLSGSVDAAPIVAEDLSVERFLAKEVSAEEGYVGAMSPIDADDAVEGRDDKDRGSDKDKKQHSPPPKTTTTTLPPTTTTTTKRPPSKHIPAPPMKHIPAPPAKHIPAPPTKHIPAPPAKHIPAPPTKQVPVPPVKGAPVPVPVPSPVMTKAKFKKLLLLLMLGSQRFKKIMSDEDHNGVAELIRDYDSGKLEDLEHMLWESYQESAGTDEDFSAFFRQLQDAASA
uniref:Uncharacterized protein n=1 Tax=Neospora caninum (strain Liverpool) TaxID=572307 RepID=F0JAU8_NEOCL|nr:hypothetical protein NCLIV_068810 [Neospora caninum Liverpool]CEL71215.1 TPA: hypothetical protein BN1204_068810 [Neospora caninum Liverpool]